MREVWIRKRKLRYILFGIILKSFWMRKIGLNQIAFFSNYSPWHFHRIFSNFHGETIGDYIKRLRLEKSAYALKITNFPILEIAIETGYASNEAFTKAFKKQFGLTPIQFRKSPLPNEKNI
jgi:AraC family transcriptional regulator